MSEPTIFSVQPGPVRIETGPLQRRGGPPLHDRLVRWLTLSRLVAVNAAILLVAIVATLAVSRALFDGQIVLEPIGVPDSLRDEGLDPAIAAQRLADAISDVYVVATAPRTVALPAGGGERWLSSLSVSTAAGQPDLVDPKSGLSFRSASRFLRTMLGIEDRRISGEFLCPALACAPDRLALTLRYHAGGKTAVITPGPVGERGLESYMQDAALRLLEEIDPAVVAAYLFQRDEKLGGSAAKALLLARRLQIEGGEDAVWGTYMLGLIEQSQGNHRAAAQVFQKAIDLDADLGGGGFAPAHVAWGVSLAAMNEHEAAVARFDAALAIAPAYANAHFNRGRSLAALRGRTNEAVAAFEAAIAEDPAMARAHRELAFVLRQLGKTVEANQHEMVADELATNLELASYVESKTLPGKSSLANVMQPLMIPVKIDPSRAGKTGDAEARTRAPAEGPSKGRYSAASWRTGLPVRRGGE
jgi:tetratricopeptide (TPR) repeat protein